MIDHEQWREFIIRPSLDLIANYSPEAEETLVAIMANESMGCTTLAQVESGGNGPYGITQTQYKAALAYINRNMDLRKRVYRAFGYVLPPPIEVIKYNLRFSTLVAYFVYKESAKGIFSKEVSIIWENYRLYYNSNMGGDKSSFVSNYQCFVGANHGIEEAQKGSGTKGPQERNGKKGHEKRT